MKIAIMTDMEGVAGVLNFKDWVEPTGRYYEQGKLLTTEEVNAAVRGFFDAGADEVVVIDGHGYGGLTPHCLDERALYSRGWAKHYQCGLHDHFDAIAWVGQHAKSGTIQSHLAHTGSPRVLERRLNGIVVGEFGLGAYIAGFYGVSSIFAAGERALTTEAKALVPHIHTVEVKYGVTLDDGADCDAKSYEEHNLGAVHLHPNIARKRIYEGAKNALEQFMHNREAYPPSTVNAPYILEEWIRRDGERPAYKTVRRHDTDLVECAGSPAEIIR